MLALTWNKANHMNLMNRVNIVRVWSPVSFVPTFSYRSSFRSISHCCHRFGGSKGDSHRHSYDTFFFFFYTARSGGA
jgi:hypothetical protein